MKGKRSGLKTKVQAENRKAVYVHCYAHTLQLAVQDSTKIIKGFRDAMDLASEICKLIKNSPKRETELRNLQGIRGPCVGIRTLCPTRYVYGRKGIALLLLLFCGVFSDCFCIFVFADGQSEQAVYMLFWKTMDYC